MQPDTQWLKIVLYLCIKIFITLESSSRIYIAIDLKSFYASVECVERGLNPLTTNLVVADASRTEKTICLAVSPPLKSYGIPGRPRLFEVIQKVDYVNYGRKLEAPYRKLTGKSVFDAELKSNPTLAVDYIVAPPRMAYYIEYSTRIYNVYLKYISADDIHVYSIDEVFIDATDYLALHKMTARQLAMTMIRDVLKTTGITATAGIGTNLYLCKIAMDIVAKHIPPDADGVRIAELDEMSYRRQLWNHKPLTDFWRIGKGIAQKLEYYGMHTMGDVARQSVKDEEMLYKIFGINAELIIDHAWGWEPCTIDYIKKYKPETNSISSGQVLSSPYDTKKARVVVQEMTDAIALNLVEKHLVTDQIVLTVSYDAESLTNPNIRAKYTGETTTDRYGRQTPKHAHGTANLDRQTSSSRLIIDATMSLYDRIINNNLLVRYINVTANHVIDENKTERKTATATIDLFTDYEEVERQSREEEQTLEKEHKMQQTIIELKRKFGKNAILKGINFEDGATAIERNKQIGGHKA